MEDVTFEQSMDMMKLAHKQQMEMLDKLIELKNMSLGKPTEVIKDEKAIDADSTDAEC